MKILVSKEFALAALAGMPVADKDKIVIGYMRDRKGLADDQAGLKDSAKVVGKLLCDMEIRMEDGKKVHAFRANYTLTEFFEDITGGKPPTHCMTLKNVVGSYVKTGLFSELDYDDRPGNCLKLAGDIARECKSDLTHPAVLKAADVIKRNPDKAAKLLREILLTVKPAAKLTPDEALEMIEQITADGQLAVVLAHVPDLVPKLSADSQKEAYVSLANALEKTDAALGDKIDGWLAEVQTARERQENVIHLQAGVPVTPVETPAEVNSEPVAA